MLQGTQSAAVRAKALRGAMSLPEVLLRRALRQRPGGLKFRRQHPSGRYVADFYCHEARLIVEVDGQAHGMGDHPQRDLDRDAWFGARGLHVQRLPATLVLRDLDAAVDAIVARAAPPLHRSPAASGPPPRSGED